ncbi:MAG: tetratricopeptide repeat protein [Gaiellaceae bacterium MAG52_C11]|nr:tetratricopeptide repeat protein [Candidatus Gaiellasilicea maunaloa]
MKKIALITILLGVSAGVLLGGILREARPSGAIAADASTSALEARQRARDTVGLIRGLQSTLSATPDDPRTLTLLGLAYHQRYRESADPTYLGRAAGLFRRTLELSPGDPEATSGLAGLALSQHRFRTALSLAREAQRLAPDSVRPYGALGDALIELGRYDEAFSTFDRMSELRPNLASYARVAYARELLGRPRTAIEAMSLALEVSAGRPEPAAWAFVELGKLHFGLGETAKARGYFRSALGALPGYVYALDWLARSEAAAGRFDRARSLSRRAVDAVPLPQFVATLADIERARGNLVGAREQYALMATIQELLRANGVNSDLELALFRVDHGIRLPEALALARTARAGRPSIYGDDVLAWALARNGRCGEALAYSKRSLRLGTKDASLYFHRGMIERCLGRDAVAREWFARALETNPDFSLIWAETARRYAS